MTFEEFLAKFKTDLSLYDSSNQIDEISIYSYYVEALKNFSHLATELTEVVLKVNNYKAVLPSDFRTLKTAFLCFPKDYQIESGYKRNFNSPIWQERKNYWQEAELEGGIKGKYIEEKIIIEDTPITFRYDNIIPLSLSKGVNRKFISMDCEIYYNRSPYEISVSGTSINANFEKGHIFFRYYAYPTDSEGKLIIPELGTGQLELYVEYYVKKRFFEIISINGKGENTFQFLQYYTGEEIRQKDKVEGDLNTVTMANLKKLKEYNRLNMKRYEVKFPN